MNVVLKYTLHNLLLALGQIWLSLVLHSLLKVGAEVLLHLRLFLVKC